MSDTVDMTKSIIHLVYSEGSMSCCNNYQAFNEYQTSDGGGQAVYTMPLKLAPTLAMYLT